MMPALIQNASLLRRLALLAVACCGGTVRAQENNPALERLYEADQAVREGDWSGLSSDSLNAIAQADAARRAQADSVLAAGGARTSADYYHAAMVFQHGSDSTAYRRAYDLGLRAVALDSANADARWIVPRAYDRWQVSLGRPQVYGTQFLMQPGEGWSLQEPNDLGAVTDAERARWGIAPKAAVLAMVTCLNETGDFDACVAARDAALEPPPDDAP